MHDFTTLYTTTIPRIGARLFPDLLWRAPVNPSRQIAYLTFDDGPTSTITPPLLDLLDRYDARATFFLIGANIQKHPLLAKQIARRGHQVGNHTFTHPDAWRTSTTTVLKELEQTTKLMEDTFAQPIQWMRPPYGRFTRPMRSWCKLRRQLLTMWDVMPADYFPGATAHAVAQRILHLIRPGSIIVLHDNPRCEGITLEAVEEVLRVLRPAGWSFPPLPLHSP